MKQILIILTLFVSLSCQAQEEGKKAYYYDKQPTAKTDLTKGATIYDTLVDRNVVIYVRDVKKKDGTVEKQYFIIEERMDEHAQMIYKRKRIYPVFKED